MTVLRDWAETFIMLGRNDLLVWRIYERWPV